MRRLKVLLWFQFLFDLPFKFGGIRLDTSISIVSTVSGEKRQRSITSVNPEATNSQLGQLGRLICGLSTHEYVETIRIDKMSTNEDFPYKKTATISWDSSTNVMSYNGDSTVYYFDKSNGNNGVAVSGNTYAATNNWVFYAPDSLNYTAAVLIVS